MLSQLQEEIRNSVEKIRERGTRLYATLRQIEDAGGTRFDENIGLPSSGLSLKNAEDRLGAVLGLISAIASAKTAQLALASQATLRALANDLGNLVKFIDLAIGPIDDWITRKITITALDVTTFNVASSQGQIDLNANLYQVDSLVDTILDRSSRIQILGDTTNFEAFFDASSGLASSQVRSEQFAMKSEAACRLAEEHVDSIAALLTKAQTAENLSQSASTAAKEHADKTLDIRNKIEAQLAFIDSTNSRAEAVKTKVEDFDSDFSDFSRKLSERNRAFEDGATLLSNLTKSLGDKEAEASTIVQNAKIALGWATAHGLANGFADSARELDEPLKSARNSAIFSFIVLAVWGLFIFFGISILIPEISLSNAIVNKEGMALYLSVFSGILARAALLAPALFFTFFSLSNYKQIYISREQYIFKKTIAASLPGFKQEANVETSSDIVKGMTAAAYERLLFNPREAISRDLAGSERMGFLSRWLVKLMQAAFEKAKPKA